MAGIMTVMKWQGSFPGPGVLVNNAKDRFEGIWVAGQMNGQGTLTRANGEKYDGAWKNDLPNGQGTLTRADGSVVKGMFRDGTLEDAVEKMASVPAAKKGAPDARAFAGISGKILAGVDGSQIALTLIEGGIERQITNPGGQPKKTTFTFMNDRLGTVVEDGGARLLAPMSLGFFRLTDTDRRGSALCRWPGRNAHRHARWRGDDAVDRYGRRRQLPQLVSRRAMPSAKLTRSRLWRNMPAIWVWRLRPKWAAKPRPCLRRKGAFIPPISARASGPSRSSR